jgi:hypothetical protein
MDATLRAWLSIPAGNIILAESVLTCFHFSEGGFPPNTWENIEQGIKNKVQAINNLFI